MKLVSQCIHKLEETMKIAGTIHCAINLPVTNPQKQPYDVEYGELIDLA